MDYSCNHRRFGTRRCTNRDQCKVSCVIYSHTYVTSNVSKNSCCAILACPHTLDWTRTRRMRCLRAPDVGGRMLLSDICLQNRYRRSSGMLLIAMPFGQYASHTNKASIASCSHSLLVTAPEHQLYRFPIS